MLFIGSSTLFCSVVAENVCDANLMQSDFCHRIAHSKVAANCSMTVCDSSERQERTTHRPALLRISAHCANFAGQKCKQARRGGAGGCASVDNGCP
jgi:hypothetical protein